METATFIPSGVNASFDRGEAGAPRIRFFDPSYVRAETILFHPGTREVHAVLHESLIFIAQAPEHMAEAFGSCEEVLLSADHYSGKPVHLRAKISRC